jgi:peptide/nickel transport system permease protein
VSRAAVAVAIGKRLGFAVLVLWLVLSLLFAALVITPNPPQTFGQEPPEADAGSPRDDGTPLVERYGNFMERYVTLEWGAESARTVGDETAGAPYENVVANKLAITTVMLLPAVVLTTLVGVVAGLYVGLNPGSKPDRVVRTVSYLGFAVPGFFLGIVVTYYGIFDFGWRNVWYDPERSLWTVYNVRRLLLPSTVMAVGILGVQLRQVRSEATSLRGEEFVKLVRAKGGGFRTVGRHVLRVSLLPVLSLFLSELLGLLLLSVIAVELVFNVPGYGTMLLDAALGKDTDPIMAVTVVTVGVGLGGRLLEDALQHLLDPRSANGGGD